MKCLVRIVVRTIHEIEVEGKDLDDVWRNAEDVPLDVQLSRRSIDILKQTEGPWIYSSGWYDNHPRLIVFDLAKGHVFSQSEIDLLAKRSSINGTEVDIPVSVSFVMVGEILENR